MDEKEQELQAGRRLETKKGMSRKAKVGIASAALALAVLAGGYLGLCAYASGDRALPGTSMGGVDLGGMTLAQAETALAQVSQDRYETAEIPIQVGSETVTFSAAQAGVHVASGADRAVREGKGGFLASGWNYLAGLRGRKNPLSLSVSVDNADYVNNVLAQVAGAVDQPAEEPHWELEETEDSAWLTLHRGRTGQSVDREAVYGALMTALGRGESGPIQAQVITAAPAEPDFDAWVGEVDREAADATLDVATNEVIAHKLGLKMDAAKARELFAGLAEGESAKLPLDVTQPEITTLELRSTLFQDILGEASSKISGTAARVGNVKLAAAACDGVVLLPGEQFSYNQTTGQRTYEKGYRAATGFGMNGTEDMIGGGVCQPSSTLYLACLNADLEIVERTNHRYTVTYMPEGMDAQVSWPNMDYVFANNTPYPIKIEMTVVDKELFARIHGTKTTDTYVEMESVRLGSTPFETIYKADPTIPQGTTKTLVSPYTGRSVEAYKNLYAADGTLISRTRISRDYYHKCDKVIGYNPLDGAPDGSVPPATAVVDPATGLPAVDPATGLPIYNMPQQAVDPATGQPMVDPVTGQPIYTTPAPAADPNAGATTQPDPAVTADPNAGATAQPDPAVTTDPNAGATAQPDPAVTVDPNAGTTTQPDPAPGPDAGAVPPPEPAPAETPAQPAAPEGIPME